MSKDFSMYTFSFVCCFTIGFEERLIGNYACHTMAFYKTVVDKWNVWSKFYIGQTGRSFKTWYTEHIKDDKKQERKRATPTWLQSVDIAGVGRSWWK